MPRFILSQLFDCGFGTKKNKTGGRPINKASGQKTVYRNAFNHRRFAVF